MSELHSGAYTDRRKPKAKNWSLSREVRYEQTIISIAGDDICACVKQCTSRKTAQGLQLHSWRELRNARRPTDARTRPGLRETREPEQHAHLAQLSGV